MRPEWQCVECGNPSDGRWLLCPECAWETIPDPSERDGGSWGRVTVGESERVTTRSYVDPCLGVNITPRSHSLHSPTVTRPHRPPVTLQGSGTVSHAHSDTTAIVHRTGFRMQRIAILASQPVLSGHVLFSRKRMFGNEL